jgi:hypothetical protein
VKPIRNSASAAPERATRSIGARASPFDQYPGDVVVVGDRGRGELLRRVIDYADHRAVRSAVGRVLELDLDVPGMSQIDRSGVQHPSPGDGHLGHHRTRHLVVDRRPADQSRVSRVDPVDVGVNDTVRGAEGRRDRDGGGVGTTATEGDDVAGRRQALESDDHGHPSDAEVSSDPGSINAGDPALRRCPLGADPRLCGRQ